MPLEAPKDFRGAFRQDPDARAVYSEGAGIQRIEPRAVAVPTDIDDLAALFDWAREQGVAVIPRGSGSGMAGGAIGAGVIVDVSRWKAIDATAIESGRVSVGPGTICGALKAALLPKKLRLPVSPSSAAFCTIGGMTATNAAGAHTLAFGSMREWVTGVEVMFADGTCSWIRRGQSASADPRVTGLLTRLEALASPARSHADHDRLRKDSSGYATARFLSSRNLVDLLVGSEGTLGLFTKIELRTAAMPAAAASVMGEFSSLGAATEAAIRAREAGAAACELLDKTFLDFVAAGSSTRFDPSTEAILLADVEGESPGSAASGARTVSTGFTTAGATRTHIATDAMEREKLWDLRHAASPMLARMSDRLKSMQFIEDGAVPPEHLGDYVRGVRAALDRHKIRGVIFGHAADAHVHVNPLIDVTADGWRAGVDALLTEVTALVASLEGTISGEHGDGRIRTPLLARVWDRRSLENFAVVKDAFDPTHLLNPGVKVGNSAGIGPIKYDPALPEIPARAARALSHVDRARDYAASRLDLIAES